MATVLLFKPSKFNGPPTWFVCAEELVPLHRYPNGEYFWLVGQSEIEEQRSADIEAVRDAEEKRWSPPPPLWRKRLRRRGTTGD